ncbi:MAG: LamG-like jellyroll fold domain-containing protein [Bacteroidota bacterium]
MKTTYLIWVFLLTCSLVFAQSTVQNGLVAYYPMDGDALDYSGNGNNGTAKNGAILTTDRAGNANSAYYFDGIDDYIEILNNSNLEPQLPVTVAAWIKLDGVPGSLATILDNNDTDNVSNGVVFLLSSSQKAALSIGDIGPHDPTSRRTKGGTTTIMPDIWYHVAIVARGPLDMDIYINGKQDCGNYSGTGSGLAYAPNSPAGAIGRGDATNIPGDRIYFKGKMDDVRLYDRPLTPDEVRELAKEPALFNEVVICEGDTVEIDAGFGATISWTSSASLVCDTCPNLSVSPSVSTTYTAITTNTATNCLDSITWFIRVDSCTTCKTNIDFSTTSSGSNYTFTPSTNANVDINNIRWDFGDGSTQILLPGTSAQHTFSTSGTYNVCAIANVGDGDGTTSCSDTVCQTFTVIGTNVNVSEPTGIQVYPNPFQDQMTVQLTASHWRNASITVVDIRGRKMYETTAKELSVVIPAQGWAEGLYIISVRNDEHTFHTKMHKK